MKSKRFEPIQGIVADSAAHLARAMAEAGHRVAEIERQVDQLKLYREEYLGKASAVRGPMDTVRLQNHRAFLARLADATRVHLQQLGVARAEYDAVRMRWSEKRVESESLGRAVARLRREEQRAADQRDQREADETGLRVKRML